MNETKYTVQLDDMSILSTKDLHREHLSNQNLKKYKLKQRDLFSQYKNDLKSIAEGQGVWLSSKALTRSIRGPVGCG